MDFIQAILLGILQGATEFLPVSSSGHLVLVPWLLGWPVPGLAFDTIVHWGTAVAVVAYFWRDWVVLIRAAVRSLHTRSLADANARLAWFLMLGTVPAAVLGYALEDWFEAMFSRPAAAAAFLMVTAGILTVAEYWGRRQRGLDTLTWRDALLIGLAQAAAILPGLSRSGATIAAGLGRDLEREPAARFSFLLATPIIFGAGLLQVTDLIQAGDLTSQTPALVAGFLAAALAGWGCIHFLLRYLQRRRLYPFALYCAIVGLACLLVVAVRG